MPKITIEALPHQLEAINAFENYKQVLLLGGVGSGKSFAGNLFLLQELKRSFQGDNSIGLISANSYGQLRRSVLTQLFQNLHAWGLDFSYNQQQSLLTVQNSKKFFCVSSEKNSVEKVRGVNCGSLYIDEGCFMDSIESYTTLLGRVRDIQGSQNIFITSSPNGFNFMYSLFAGELKTEDRHIVKAKTKDNIHIDKNFYVNMKSNLDEKMVLQELEGEFVNLSGYKSYYAFDRNIHVKDLSEIKKKFESKRVIGFIGVDVNIDPYCTVQGYLDNNIFYVTDETVITGGADTPMMINKLLDKGYSKWNLVADSTFSKRQSTGKSDKKYYEQYFNVLPSRNPYITDKVSNTNRILGQRRLVIDKNCKWLIKDLEQVVWKENGKLDGSNRELTHVSDALAYWLWHCDPIQGSIKGRSYSIKR